MIPKKDAELAAEEHHRAAAKALEERVDIAIKARTSNAPIWVDVDDIPTIAVDRVRRLYEAGGWRTSTAHDQRSGSALLLE